MTSTAAAVTEKGSEVSSAVDEEHCVRLHGRCLTRARAVSSSGPRAIQPADLGKGARLWYLLKQMDCFELGECLIEQ